MAMQAPWLWWGIIFKKYQLSTQEWHTRKNHTGWPASPSKQVVFFARYGYGWLCQKLVSTHDGSKSKIQLVLTAPTTAKAEFQFQ